MEPLIDVFVDKSNEFLGKAGLEEKKDKPNWGMVNELRAVSRVFSELARIYSNQIATLKVPKCYDDLIPNLEEKQ